MNRKSSVTLDCGRRYENHRVLDRVSKTERKPIVWEMSIEEQTQELPSHHGLHSRMWEGKAEGWPDHYLTFFPKAEAR